MTPKQTQMAEALIEVPLSDQDARFIQNIIMSDSALDEAEDFALIQLYDSEYGYGVE